MSWGEIAKTITNAGKGVGHSCSYIYKDWVTCIKGFWHVWELLQLFIKASSKSQPLAQLIYPSHPVCTIRVWSLFTNCILHLEGNISVWCILLFLHSLNCVYVYASKQKIMIPYSCLCLWQTYICCVLNSVHKTIGRKLVLSIFVIYSPNINTTDSSFVCCVSLDFFSPLHLVSFKSQKYKTCSSCEYLPVNPSFLFK